MTDDVKVAILSGGVATRLRPITTNVPKSMLLVAGKPFLAHQIALLRQYDLRNVVLCVGHLKEIIKSYFKDGSSFGVKIEYSEEEDGKLLGTAGALKNAEPLLGEEFLVLNGDSYVPVNCADVVRHFRAKNKLGLMVVYRNCNLYDRSNVAIRDGLVVKYDRERQDERTIYIDYGLSMLTKKALDLVPGGQFARLDEIYQQLIQLENLVAFEAQNRFYEIGSFRGLEEFKNLVEQKTK